MTIESFENTAAVERLYSYTLGIANRAIVTEGVDPVLRIPAREWEAPGTGVAGRWGEHYFVLTAAHVVANATPENLGLFARPYGELQHASEVTMRDAFDPMVILEADTSIHRCNYEDLAVITLPRAGVLGSYLEFFDFSTPQVEVEEGQRVVGMGYPVASATMFGRQVGREHQRAVLLCPIVFGGNILATSIGERFRDFNPDRHYLMQYERGIEGEHPRGISGAAAWLWDPSENAIWTPRFEFAGICTSCYREGTIEKIVKASVVCEFLAETFGSISD